MRKLFKKIIFPERKIRECVGSREGFNSGNSDYTLNSSSELWKECEEACAYKVKNRLWEQEEESPDLETY